MVVFVLVVARVVVVLLAAGWRGGDGFGGG